MSDRSGVALPGDNSDDPAAEDIDAVAFALDRARTFLRWVEEHRAGFVAGREIDPAAAELELGNLAHSTAEAQRHLARLVDLLMAGYTIDPSKRLPRGLQRHAEPRAAPDPAA